MTTRQLSRKGNVLKLLLVSLIISVAYCIAIQAFFQLYFPLFSERERKKPTMDFQQNFPDLPPRIFAANAAGSRRAAGLLDTCPVLSPEKTKLHLLTPRGSIVQGSRIQLLLETFSHEGRRAGCGGDFFYAAMYNRKISESLDSNDEPLYTFTDFSSTVGHVSDHKNGTYSISFFAGWSGYAVIKVTLVHPLMVVRTLNNHYKHREKRLYWTGFFSQDAVPSSEGADSSFSLLEGEGAQWQYAASYCYLMTRKSIANQPSSDNAPQCIYHHRQLGERTRVICSKPAGTPCRNLDTITFNSDNGFNYMALSSLYIFYDERLEIKKTMQQPYYLLQSNFSNIPVGGYKYITILSAEAEEKERPNDVIVNPFKIPKKEVPFSRNASSPISGYWSSLTRWESLEQNNYHWSIRSMRNCLRGKDVYLFGDSTIRQWFYYFTSDVTDDVRPLGIDSYLIPEDKFEANAYSVSGKWYHLNTQGEGINISYFLHPWARGGPRRFKLLPGEYTAALVNSLPRQRCNYVVVVSLWAHFTVLPEEVYVDRLLGIRAALKRLLRDCPDTQIVVKGSHHVGIQIDARRLHWSDWLYYDMNRIVKKVFGRMNVHFLNVWDLNLAYSYLHDQASIHMPKIVISQEISLFLSSICTPD